MDDWQKQWWKQIEKTTAEVEEFWVDVAQTTESVMEEVSGNLGSFFEQFQSGIIEEVDGLLEDLVDVLIVTSEEIDAALGENWSDFTDDDFTNVDYHAPSAQNNPACINCANYHGQSYNGNLLVCAMHPVGWDGDSCPDWQEDR